MKFAVIAPVAAGVTARSRMDGRVRPARRGLRVRVDRRRRAHGADDASTAACTRTTHPGGWSCPRTARCPIPLTCWRFWQPDHRLGPGDRRAGTAQPPSGGAGQTGGHRRCAFGRPGAALRGHGMAEGGDRGVRCAVRQPRPPRRRTARGDAAAVGGPAGRRELLTASSSTSTTPRAIRSQRRSRCPSISAGTARRRPAGLAGSVTDFSHSVSAGPS